MGIGISQGKAMVRGKGKDKDQCHYTNMVGRHWRDDSAKDPGLVPSRCIKQPLTVYNSKSMRSLHDSHSMSTTFVCINTHNTHTLSLGLL